MSLEPSVNVAESSTPPIDGLPESHPIIPVVVVGDEGDATGFYVLREAE